MLCSSHHHHRYLSGIRDVAMREIRNKIIIIQKDSMKRFNQLYHILRSNPHLGYQFHLRSWIDYILCSLITKLCKLFKSLYFREYMYYIRSYPPIIISCILDIIISLLFPINPYAALVVTFIYLVSLLIIAVIRLITSFILLPWYCLKGLILPKNIELSIAYYRDMFDSNPDLDPPVIIDEMSDKLRSIVDNYIPLPSTTAFDYIRLVKEKKTITFRYTGEHDDTVHEILTEVTGHFIEFIKYTVDNL